MEESFSQGRKPVTKIEHVQEEAVSDAVLVGLLQRHGCTIEQTTVHFPPGTVAQEILLRWGSAERYTIFLPNGVELLWKQNRRFIGEPAQSMLQVSKELYEQERIAAQAALEQTDTYT